MDLPFARFDPRAKLIGMLVAVGAVAALQAMPSAVVALVAGIAVAAAARVPMTALIYRLGLVAIAVAPVALLLPLYSGEAGFALGSTIALKALAITAIAYTGVSLSPSPTLGWAARQFGVPRPLVRIGLLTRRFGFVLGHEAAQMRIAARCRGGEFRVHPHSLRTTGTLVGALMIRSVSRAERVAHALQCRGDVGEIRLMNLPRFRAADALLITVVAAAAVGLLVWDYRLAH